MKNEKRAIFYAIGYEKAGKRGIVVKKKSTQAQKEYDKIIKTPGITKACLLEYYSKNDFKIIEEFEHSNLLKGADNENA